MSRVDMHKAMRFKSQYTPKTAAERQRKYRAIKRGTYRYCEQVPQPPLPPGLEIPSDPNLLPHVIAERQRLELSAPTPSQPARALPAPPAPPAQKSLSSDSRSLALLLHEGRGEESGDGPPRLCLPAGVAARLRSLLDKHEAGGKSLTAAERAEAEGLLDIAEYFVVQRLRQRLAG